MVWAVKGTFNKKSEIFNLQICSKFYSLNSLEFQYSKSGTHNKHITETISLSIFSGSQNNELKNYQILFLRVE
jgi:hypothetical protein